MSEHNANVVRMDRTPGAWVYEQQTDAHGIYSETGAMIGEMWRGVDAKFVAAAPARIEELEAALQTIINNEDQFSMAYAADLARAALKQD